VRHSKGAHQPIVPDALTPILYAVAMGMGAIGALVFGRLYDRVGIPVVFGAFFISAFFAPLVFLESIAKVLELNSPIG
jgi:MFS family permease